MIFLEDKNFEEFISNSQKPVLVDFFALWCAPCKILGPILEKLEEEFKDQIIFSKVETDSSPNISLKFGIQNLPTVLYFERAKPIAGFVGLRSEEEIRNWLKEILAGKEKREIEFLFEELQDYAKKHALKLNSDKKIVETIIRGLLANEKKYGWRFCPCKKLTGDFKEDWKKICPCAFHWEEIEKDGKCHCGLFVKDFRFR